MLGDFNPRSPCGLRRSALDIALLYMKFQSTQSLRTATPICANNLHRIVVFQSTQSLRTATGSLTTFHFISPISIHAVLADCDIATPAGTLPPSISIHAVLADCDIKLIDYQTCHLYFNPRSPCGLRLCCVTKKCKWNYFNPRSPCGLRPSGNGGDKTLKHFNPRSPCGLRLRPRKLQI